MEEDTPGRRHMKSHEDLRVEERERHHLFKLIDVTFQTPNIVKVDIGVNTKGISVSQCLPVLDFPQVGWRSGHRLGWIGIRRLPCIEETEAGWCECRGWCHSHHATNGFRALHVLFVTAI